MLLVSSFHYVINTNNQGCDYVACGDLFNASACFSNTIQQIFVTAASAPPLEEIFESSYGILPLPNDATRRRQPIELNLRLDHAFLHAHPIRMLDDVVVFSRHLDENNKIYFALSVFNLACTIHLDALRLVTYQLLSSVADQEDASAPRQQFEHAKSLYLRAFRLVYDTLRREGFQATGNAILDLLIMALYNNIGLLYLEVSGAETWAAGVIFQSLHAYATSVYLYGTQGGEEGSAQYHEWIRENHGRTLDIFILNGTMMGLTTAMAAAAA